MSEPVGPDEGVERSGRERPVVMLLRQLWLGLSTYRLYPENPERPGMAAWVASNRISEQIFVLKRNPYFIGVDA